MKAKLSTELNRETMLKLTRKAARAGLTPQQAMRMIALRGVAFFCAHVVGATTK